ncbi:MAG: hypothetical protein E3J93_02545 [Dehalococcoidia bacterium]|nr:MAG: hypothetical protein E3J93_02545 [Dehalococcoidia bacterium]
MFTTIVGIIIVVLSGIIALFALSMGGYPSMLKLLFYLRFPPARFYFNAMRAIEKLEALSFTPPFSTPQILKQGLVDSSDVGFEELTEILRENRILSGEVEEIILVELRITGGIKQGNIPLTPEKMRFLGLIQKGEQVIVQQEQFDLNRITRDLQERSEEITRRGVARWLVGLILLYMIAGIYLVATT